MWLVFFTAGLAAAGMTLSWRGPLSWNLAFWLLAALAAEFMWIRLPFGQATLSMASCAHFAALLLLPRGQAMAVVAISGALAEAVVLRKPPRRVLFNASQSALATGAASLVLSAGGGGVRVLADLSTGATMLWLVVAAFAYFVVNTGAVSMAVALSQGSSPLAAWRRNFGNRYELLSSGALFSLGIVLALHCLHLGIGGAMLEVLPLVLAHQGYRLYLRQTHEPSGHTATTHANSEEVIVGESSQLHDRSA